MSVSSISSVSSASSASSTSSTSLTDETKAKLKALGLDPSKYTSESQAEAAIATAQNSQNANSSAKSGKPQNSEFESIKSNAQSLASGVGVSVSKQDKVSDILSNVSAKLAEMQTEAGTDPKKLGDLEKFQASYNSISTSLSNLESKKQAGQAQLTGSLSGLATYNQAFLNMTNKKAA